MEQKIWSEYSPDRLLFALKGNGVLSFVQVWIKLESTMLLDTNLMHAIWMWNLDEVTDLKKSTRVVTKA